MVTTDEIRRRVEAADQARITQRVEVAEALATDYASWQRIQQELAEAGAHLAIQFLNAQPLMTLAELAAFTDITEADLRAASRSVKDPRGRKTVVAKPTRSRQTRAPRPRKAAAAAESVAAPVPASADVPTA